MALALAVLPLLGCEESYSALVKYTLRTDPLPLLGEKIGDERMEPDRPAQLPLMSVKDLLEPFHPMTLGTKLLRNGVLLDPNEIDPKDRAVIKTYLDSWFGSPRHPTVKDAPPSLLLDDKTLARGSQIYRLQCLHCHGVNGDGRGVTAKWINPHPRDFRQAMFKFQSVDQVNGPAGSPPRREDLRRTITLGVEATGMPAFNINLKKDEIEDVVSYVIHLSLRGRLEYDTMKTMEGLEVPIDEQMADLHKRNLDKWVKAATKAIKPTAYPYKEGDVTDPAYKASVLRGYHLFKGDVTKETPEAKTTNCVSCHKNFGREATFRWDGWGTLVRPNNLTNGIYRGGRRPVDLYNRMHSGINGSGMVAFGGLEKDNPKILWDLVNFVQVLPYPKMREAMGIKID